MVDFRAGHSVYEDDQLFQSVAELLAPYPCIFLLLPSSDLAESLLVLSGRDETAAQLADVNQHLLQHHSNYDLARFVVYTGNQLPSDICDEVLWAIDANDFKQYTGG